MSTSIHDILIIICFLLEQKSWRFAQDKNKEDNRREFIFKQDKKMKKAVFLDRDGTLNIDYGYVHDIDHFHFIEGSIEALKKLKEMGYLLVLVTNQ